MIRVSTKGRYGLNAVFALSQSEGNQPLSIKQIADGTSVPLNYMEQILINLRKNGYVESTRGAKGGYSLAKEPKDINMYDLLNILEGEIFPVHCKHGGNCANHGESPHCCAGEIVWDRINKAVKEAVGDYTLQDLIDDFNKK
ncbi:MAG: RrF2 family transcriptional regulator [Clostridia bacterium]|nr:RrF2 family transcriptional regulator [Clostridia bacterium]